MLEQVLPSLVVPVVVVLVPLAVAVEGLVAVVVAVVPVRVVLAVEPPGCIGRGPLLHLPDVRPGCCLLVGEQMPLRRRSGVQVSS